MVGNLNDEHALGDKALTSAFNDKLARWVSIQYAAAAQALVASEADPLAKWSRLGQLCADVSRLRRGDLFAERLDLDRQWLAIDQANNEQAREKDFQAWLKRPEIQAKYFLKQKQGISKRALDLIDNYLLEGISPLDPDEVTDSSSLGRHATQPPIGCQPKKTEEDSKVETPPANSKRRGHRSSSPRPATKERGEGQPVLRPVLRSAPGEGGSAFLTSVVLSTEEVDEGGGEGQPVIQNPASSNQHSIPPSPPEVCLECRAPLPALLPNGDRPVEVCGQCGVPLLRPGIYWKPSLDRCLDCNTALPHPLPSGERPLPRCHKCGVTLHQPERQLDAAPNLNPATSEIAAPASPAASAPELLPSPRDEGVGRGLGRGAAHYPEPSIPQAPVPEPASDPANFK